MYISFTNTTQYNTRSRGPTLRRVFGGSFTLQSAGRASVLAGRKPKDVKNAARFSAYDQISSCGATDPLSRAVPLLNNARCPRTCPVTRRRRGNRSFLAARPKGVRKCRWRSAALHGVLELPDAGKPDRLHWSQCNGARGRDPGLRPDKDSRCAMISGW